MLDHFVFSKDLIDTPKDRMILIGDAGGRKGDFSRSDLDCANKYGIDYLDVDDV